MIFFLFRLNMQIHKQARKLSINQQQKSTPTSNKLNPMFLAFSSFFFLNEEVEHPRGERSYIEAQVAWYRYVGSVVQVYESLSSEDRTRRRDSENDVLIRFYVA